MQTMRMVINSLLTVDILDYISYLMSLHFVFYLNSLEPGMVNDNYCDMIDIMAGYIYYSLNDTYTSNSALYMMIKNRSWIETNSMAYNISYYATSYGFTKQTYTDRGLRERAFEFCNFNSLTCSLVVFDSYDARYQYVNEYYFQLPHGACTDTFTISNWSRLQDNPPTSLTELYFECTQAVSINKHGSIMCMLFLCISIIGLYVCVCV